MALIIVRRVGESVNIFKDGEKIIEILVHKKGHKVIDLLFNATREYDIIRGEVEYSKEKKDENRVQRKSTLNNILGKGVGSKESDTTGQDL
jgi:sRNA-binding carbon storage regulator CsrA